MVKNPLVMWETWIPSPGWEDPIEKGTATHTSILAWRIPIDRGAWQTTVHAGTESSMTETRHSTAGQNYKLLDKS